MFKPLGFPIVKTTTKGTQGHAIMKTLKTALLTTAVAATSFAGFTGSATAKTLIDENLTDPTEAITQNVISQIDEGSPVKQPTLVSQHNNDYYVKCVIWEQCYDPNYSNYHW